MVVVSGSVSESESGVVSSFSDASGSRVAAVVDDCGRFVRVHADEGVLDVTGATALYADLRAAENAPALPMGDRGVTADWLSDVDRHVVATHRDAVVSHGTIEPTEDGPATLTLAVHPAYRSAHVGTHVLRILLRYARETGTEAVRSAIDRSNDAAIALARGYGFSVDTADASTLELRASLHGAAAPT